MPSSIFNPCFSGQMTLVFCRIVLVNFSLLEAVNIEFFSGKKKKNPSPVTQYLPLGLLVINFQGR